MVIPWYRQADVSFEHDESAMSDEGGGFDDDDNLFGEDEDGDGTAGNGDAGSSAMSGMGSNSTTASAARLASEITADDSASQVGEQHTDSGIPKGPAKTRYTDDVARLEFNTPTRTKQSSTVWHIIKRITDRTQDFSACLSGDPRNKVSALLNPSVVSST